MGFKREQFTFYRSFVRAAEQLPPKQRAEFLAAVIYYALDEIEPEKLSNAARATFEVVRPILDKARRKAQSGKNGGEASGETRKQIEANSKQTGSKSKQTRSTGDSPVITGADTVTGTVTDTVTDTVTGADMIASPDGESNEAFSDVFEALERIGEKVSDKMKTDVGRICAEYGTTAVLQAIERAEAQEVPRWSYIRAIVTSGGVQKTVGASHRVRETNAQIQRHHEFPAPDSAYGQAIQEMLAWDEKTQE